MASAAPAPWTLVALQAAHALPWPNGAGSTRELLAWPAQGEPRVGLFVDELQAAAVLPRVAGRERLLAVLEGEGVLLRAPRAKHRLARAGEPLRLDAALATECQPVRGTARQLHVLALPGHAVLLRVRGDVAFATGGPTLLAVYAHAAPAQVRADASAWSVPPYHLGWRLQEQPLAGSVDGADALFLEAS